MAPLLTTYDEVVACDRSLSRWWLKRARAIARAYRAESAAGFDGFQSSVLAATLGVHEQAAQRLIGEALALEALPGLAAAVEDGRMSPPALTRVLDWLALVTPEDAPAVTADLLARTAGWGTRTAADWGRAARAAVLRSDPRAEDRRRKAAADDRHVRSRPAFHGLAWVTLLLEAGDAAAVMDAVTAAAEELRADGDADDEACEDATGGRGIEARRADAAVALLTGRPARSGRPEDVERLACAAVPAAPRSRWQVDLVVPAAVLQGTTSEPAELRGHGAVTPAHARELLAEGAEVRPVFVCHESGELLAVGARTWTVAAPHDVRRVLDEVLRSSARTPVAEPGYVPSASLRRFVLARERVSRFPGSSTPSAACDLDHGRAYDRGGATSSANLAPLNRRAHRLKQRGVGWARLPDGRVRWSGPGRRALYRPSDRRRPPPLVGRH